MACAVASSSGLERSTPRISAPMTGCSLMTETAAGLSATTVMVHSPARLLILVERLTFDGAAAQHPLLLLRPVGARMQAREVVPHHEIADAPLVVVDDLIVFDDVEA